MNQRPKNVTRLLTSLGLETNLSRSWALYDVANSAFACTIMVAILPVYFADVVAAEMDSQSISSTWAYMSALAALLIACLAPIMGVLADRFGFKKKFLAFFTGVGASASSLLYFAQSGDIALTIGLYLLASIAFGAGEVFYESLLPHITQQKRMHTTSASAYALGYLGGGLLLALNLAWISNPKFWGISSGQVAVNLSFLSVGIWWLLFSIPLFKTIPEPNIKKGSSQEKAAISTLIKEAIFELKQTFSHIRTYKMAFLFLLAYWLYSDGVGTIMKLAVIYGKEVGIENQDLIGAILLVQFLGVPATFAFGPITEKIGAKKTLYLCLTVYTAITALAYFMSNASHFWSLAIAIALVQGATQAISRSLYAGLIPVEKSSEFFSFFSISSKFAGVIGPLVFALVSDALGDSRYSLIFVASLFLIGMYLLTKVNLDEGKKAVAQS